MNTTLREEFNRWAEQWAAIFRAAGLKDATHERVVDPPPSPEDYGGRWIPDAAQLRAFQAEAALLVCRMKGMPWSRKSARPIQPFGMGKKRPPRTAAATKAWPERVSEREQGKGLD